MKLAVLIAVLLLPTLARAETFGFVDVSRVYAQATEAGRIAAPLNQAIAQKRAEQQGALERGNAAGKAGKKADLAKEQKLYDEDQAEIERDAKERDGKLSAKLAPILAKLKTERHLAEVLPVVPLTPTKADLTDEVIRRWNAADAEGMAAELARTKAELAAAKAKPPAPAK